MTAPRLTRWQRVAVQLGETIGRDRLVPEVTALADAAARGVGQRRAPWVVAVSGGSDSVALVLLLWAHWPSQRTRLVLAHFDHRLRGAESTADARFCRTLAKGLGVRCEVGRWDARPTTVSEANARAARNVFLAGVQRRCRAKLIWTGHQRDDVAETMLMRLARGSGTSGLAAPRPIQEWGATGRRLRPMLGLGREELRDAVAAAGGRWREDVSNQRLDFFRNRVRANVIPAWREAAGRDAVAGAAWSRTLLAEDDEALEAWLEELAPGSASGDLDLARLTGRPTALWRRAVRRWLVGQGDVGDLSRQGFEDLLRLVRAGKTSRFSLGTSGFARIRRGRLFFEKLERPLLG